MSPSLPEAIRLLLPDGTVKRLLLEDYLRGVVAGALPADAPLEAMKALSVAARTFAANTHRHTDLSADVCTLRHCQTWNARANPRAARAVMETRGIVATFNDNLIEAFYFEHCDGKTRDAKGVLMNAPGYLKSVSCQCGFASMKGHGIGMCMRGMLAMANAGDSYEFILKHYYSRIALVEGMLDSGAPFAEPPATTRGTTTLESTPVRIMPVKPIVRKEVSLPPAAEETKPATLPPAAPEAGGEKPVRKTAAPRRAPRKKVEQESIGEPGPSADVANESKAEPSPSTEIAQEPNATTAPAISPSEGLVTFESERAAEVDDLLLFLAMEDAGHVADQPKPGGERVPVAPKAEPDASFVFQPPPLTGTAAAVPPPSMPEEMPDALDLEMFATAPESMPEEMPSASELDFLAPPVVLSIEPNLADLMPPVEKFYTPLDAPPTMPEGLPTFDATGSDETPFAWVAPPPMQESAFAVKQPQVLMDSLPGPRVIAGNLHKPGMLVTIHDSRGNSIVTVSGMAKQYGAGGFEAPLTDDGAYHVKFDGTELDLSLANETVFIYFG